MQLAEPWAWRCSTFLRCLRFVATPAAARLQRLQGLQGLQGLPCKVPVTLGLLGPLGPLGRCGMLRDVSPAFLIQAVESVEHRPAKDEELRARAEGQEPGEAARLTSMLGDNALRHELLNILYFRTCVHQQPAMLPYCTMEAAEIGQHVT